MSGDQIAAIVLAEKNQLRRGGLTQGVESEQRRTRTILISSDQITQNNISSNSSKEGGTRKAYNPNKAT